MIAGDNWTRKLGEAGLVMRRSEQKYCSLIILCYVALQGHCSQGRRPWREDPKCIASQSLPWVVLAQKKAGATQKNKM